MGGASEEEYEKVNVTQTIALATKAKESGLFKEVDMINSLALLEKL